VEVRVVSEGRIGAVGASWVADGLAEARRTGRTAPTLMPALGASALPVYAELAAMRDRRELDTGGVRLVQLDEYADLPDGEADPRSLRAWLERDVARPLAIPRERVIALDGAAPDVVAACRAYDEAVVAAGGIDVAVLGLGPNGHLGFNEPPSAPDSPTRRIDLSEASLASNARYFPGRSVPRAALTAGMSTILAARRILLVVHGAHKRSILLAMLTRPIGPDLPASALRSHPGTLLLSDPEAWPIDGPPRPAMG
jgi:glucosamine-6-phosphate deaminase